MSDSEGDETEITTEEWTRTVSVMKKKKTVLPSRRKSSVGGNEVQSYSFFFEILNFSSIAQPQVY